MSDALETLQQIVSREFQVLDSQDDDDEEHFRLSCETVVKAIGEFLASSNSDLPRSFLSQTVSRIIGELGPGDTLFRRQWLSILRRTKQGEPLEFVLEFVPSCARLDDEEAAKDILKGLKYVLQESSFQPVLKCIRKLVQGGKALKIDVFNLLSEIIAGVPKECADSAYRCLVENAKTEEELELAVETIRNHATQMRKAGSNEENSLLCFYFAVASQFFELKQEFINPGFFNMYFLVLFEKFGEARSATTDHETMDVIDVLVILLHHNDTEHELHELLDSSLANINLTEEVLLLLAKLAGVTDPPHRRVSIRKAIVESLAWLLVFICVGPHRTPRKLLPDDILPLAKRFGTFLLLESTPQCREHMVKNLLHLNEQFLRFFNLKAATNRVDGGIKIDTSIVQKEHATTCAILAAVSETCPASLRSHRASIVRSLQTAHVSKEASKYLCKILVRISCGVNSQESDETRDLVFVVRTLLFSLDTEDGADSTNLGASFSLRGLSLISELVKNGRCGTPTIRMLWRMLRVILLPPTKGMLDPEVGSAGLQTLRAFHDWSKTAGLPTEKEILRPGVFPTITSVLVKPRLVKTLSSKNKATCKDTCTGYAKYPLFLMEPHETKPRKFQKMLFTLDHLLKCPGFSEPKRWVQTTIWVNDLIDTYLALGRSKSRGKWVPHAWVEAPFEFPLADLSKLRSTSGRQQRIVGTVSSVLEDFDVGSPAPHSKNPFIKEFGYSIKQLKRAERTELVEQLLRYSLAYCVGQALTIGVLENTYQHYKSVLDGSVTKERREALRLMEYQLLKFYHLGRKCQAIEVMLRGVSNYRSTRTNPRGKKRRATSVPNRSFFEKAELYSSVILAVEALKTVRVSFAAVDAYFQTNLLWHCLADESQDKVLIEYIRGTQEQDSIPMPLHERVGIIIDMRLSILDHLIGYLKCQSGREREDFPTTMPSSMFAELVRGQFFFEQFLRLASLLMSHVCNSGDRDSMTVATLAASYFRLMLLMMELLTSNHASAPDDVGRDQNIKTSQEFSQLYYSVLGGNGPSTDSISWDVSPHLTFRAVSKPFTRCFGDHMDARIAIEMLETLSFFSLRQNTRDAIEDMVEFSWSSIHTTFENADASWATGAPLSLVTAIRQILPGALLKSRRNQGEAAVRETVLKSAFQQLKLNEKQQLFIHGMLRLWGFLVLAERHGPSSADYIHQLYKNIHLFLKDAKQPAIARNNNVLESVESSDDDGDYVPPAKRARVEEPLLPQSRLNGVDARNFVAYFQVVLDMTVASSALFFPQKSSKWMDNRHGPYRELCKLVDTFGLLIALFRSKIHIFPHPTLSSVLNASRSMLNVTTFASMKCAEWRSSQPAVSLEAMEINEFDPASVQFLSLVFDGFGTNVIGSLNNLCDTISQGPYGPGQVQKMKSLRNKIDKISAELGKLAKAHNLSIPACSEEKSSVSGKNLLQRRKIDPKRFSPGDEVSVEQPDESTNSLAGEHPTSWMVAHREDPEAGFTSEDATTLDEGSSDENSFGADGDWGRDSEEEDED